MSSKYVVFDRDGTLIQHHHHLADSKLVKLMPLAIECLSELVMSRFRFGIITNQSVISRKLADLETVNEINNTMLKLFGDLSEYFDFLFLCPHSPDDLCMCRKPNPQLGLRAINEFKIDQEKSFMIGDQSSDFQFAKNIQITPIIVHNQEFKCENWFPDLLSAARFIVENV